MKKRPHILIIGGWTEPIKKALDIGFRVTYFGPFSASATFDPEILKQCDFIRELNVDRIGICLAFAKDIHTQDPFLASISFNEIAMETAAVIATALDIQGLELWPVVVTRYKDLMRQVLSDHPQLALPWKRVSTPDELKDFYTESGPAIIAKPITGVGSVGVEQIKSPKELTSYLKAENIFPVGGLLVEQLVDSGDLFSIESLTVKGTHHIITMSLSKIVGYPYSLQNYIVVPPPNLSEVVRESIALCVKQFLDVIGIKSGVAHTEVKVSAEGRAGIIESQTRVGGDGIWQMLEITTGVKQIDLAMKSLIGDVELIDIPESAGVAAFVCILPPSGIVKQVAVTDFIEDIEDILDYKFDVRAGEFIDVIKDNRSRRGYVFMKAIDHMALFHKMRLISEHYWVEYENGQIWHPSFEIPETI